WITGHDHQHHPLVPRRRHRDVHHRGQYPDHGPAGTVLANRAVLTTSSFELNTDNNSSSASVTVIPPPIAPHATLPTAAAPGGGSSGSPSATAAAINASVQDAAIATSGGLVADVLRQKTLSGLLGFVG